MSVKFVINEAPRVYVEAININGNTLTQDKVVRREFRLAEGDAFNSLAVKRSTARINSLGYFQENFEVEQEQGSAPDRIVLNANVQEQATGELQLSAGFSSLESFILQGSVRQRNFRGRGQTVGVSVDWSRYSRAFTLSFAEPAVFDRNLSMGIDLYRRDLNNWYGSGSNRVTTFRQATTGFSVRAGVPLTENASLIGRYTLNFDQVSLDESRCYSNRLNPPALTCDPILAGRYLCDAIGDRVSSILGLSLVYDNLDNRNRPTRGESLVVSLDVAGLGGTERYAKLRLNAAKYWNLGGNWIFSIRGEAGYVKGLKDRGAGAGQCPPDRPLLPRRPADPRLRYPRHRPPYRPPVLRHRHQRQRPVRRRNLQAGLQRQWRLPVRCQRSQEPHRRPAGRRCLLSRSATSSKFRSARERANWASVRPSLWMRARCSGSRNRSLTDTGPTFFIATRDPITGAALYQQIDTAILVNGQCVATATSNVPNATNPNTPPCLTSNAQHAARQHPARLPRDLPRRSRRSRALRWVSASTGIPRSVRSGSTSRTSSSRRKAMIQKDSRST